MTREKGKNTAASIRARLLALAQNKGEDYQRVLGRYAIERFLYRLGRSPYRDKFAVKGATLFTLWTGHTHRPTKDLDLLGQGSSAIGDVEQTIRGICEIQEEDGLVFDRASVEGTKIKEDDEYDGVRVKVLADLAGARIPMQIDIGFGDAVYPEPELASFPVLLHMEAPLIRAYPREASTAEKFQAMILLDIRNSRMKDFYDIWFIANTWTFDMASLRRAILASFERRGSATPTGVPFALTLWRRCNETARPPSLCHSCSLRCRDRSLRHSLLHRRRAETQRDCRGVARRIDSRCSIRASELQPRQELVGEKVRRETRWASAHATPLPSSLRRTPARRDQR